MHSWHYNDPNGGRQWAFHANGDPLPGDVLINQFGPPANPEGGPNNPDEAYFRTTSEELLIFVATLKLEAAAPILMFKTTSFVPAFGRHDAGRPPADTDEVLMRAIMRKEPDDATEMKVPILCIKQFAEDILRRKIEYLLDEVDDGFHKFENLLERLNPDQFLIAAGLITVILNRRE